MATEKEAATLVCPILEIRTHGRRALNPKQETCIGSRCAMWRWENDGLVHGRGKEPVALKQEERGGYCGMAGKP